MSQPHITELGAFDPIQAFGQTFANLSGMYEGLLEDPEAIPPEEIIRASIVTIDLLEAITETTITSLLSMMSRFMPPEIYDTARREYMAAKEARTPEESREYKMTLMRKVSTFIPHEAPYEPPTPDA